MADLLQMRQVGREAGDTPEQPLPQQVGAALQGEGGPELVRDRLYPDLLYRLTEKSTGIARLADGRYAYVCGRHLLARLAVVQDPVDLARFTCRVCDAELEAAAERRRFKELLHD